jgi:hypothetical protein
MKRLILISSPGAHNLMFLLTTSQLMHSWISVQLQTRILSYIRCPPVESVFVTAPDIRITSHANRTLTTEISEYELQAYIQKRNQIFTA